MNEILFCLLDCIGQHCWISEQVIESLRVPPPHKRCYKQRNKGRRRQSRWQSDGCKHWTGGASRGLRLPSPWHHTSLPPLCRCRAMQPRSCLPEPREQFLRQARHMQGAHKLQEMKAVEGTPSSPITPASLRPARPSCKESEPGPQGNRAAEAAGTPGWKRSHTWLGGTLGELLPSWATVPVLVGPG